MLLPSPVRGPEKIPKISKNQKLKTENRNATQTNEIRRSSFSKNPNQAPKSHLRTHKASNELQLILLYPLSLLLRHPSLSLTRRLLNGLSGNHWHRVRNDNNNNKSSNNTKKRQAKNQWKISKQTEEAAGRIVKNGRSLGELRKAERNWRVLGRTEGDWEELREAAKNCRKLGGTQMSCKALRGIEKNLEELRGTRRNPEELRGSERHQEKPGNYRIPKNEEIFK